MNTTASRRTFLGHAAMVPLAIAAGLPARLAGAAGSPIRRVGGAYLKPAVNAYSFLELLNANAKDASRGLDLFGVCDFCAELDSEAVDLTGYFFPGYPAAPPDDYLVRLKRHAFDRGLAISGTGVRNDFTTSDAAVRAEGIQRIKTWIEVAARLGAPTVRAFADSQPPYRSWQQASREAPRETVEGWIAGALRECAEHGRRFGVVVAVQNHGDFISTGAQHLALLDRVDHPWCAALVDTGKYLTPDPYADIALVAPYAANWQVKETLDSSTASPRLDVARLVGIVRRAGYRGYVPIETLSMRRQDYDARAEVTRLFGALRRAIDASR